MLLTISMMLYGCCLLGLSLRHPSIISCMSPMVMLKSYTTVPSLNLHFLVFVLLLDKSCDILCSFHHPIIVALKESLLTQALYFTIHVMVRKDMIVMEVQLHLEGSVDAGGRGVDKISVVSMLLKYDCIQCSSEEHVEYCHNSKTRQNTPILSLI